MINKFNLGGTYYQLLVKPIVTSIILCISVFACSTENIVASNINTNNIATIDDSLPKKKLATDVNANQVYSKALPHSAMSEDGIYRVSLYSSVFPIPLQKIHSWPVHIEYASGKPLLNAKIYIHGGMPEHRHEFPTVPRVRKNLGNGDFLIEGMKFNMHGDWELRINIKEEKQRDRAVFHISIIP